MSGPAIGRAKTVIVSHSGAQAQAAVSTVVAGTREGSGPPGRIHFTGSVDIDVSTQKHIADAVLPLVDRILKDLQLPPQDYDLAVVNLGFASAAEIPLRVKGFSADAPIFLALLSAALKLPLADDVVTTGHIASPDGDISLVKSIPEKLEAAAADPGIDAFLYPSLSRDASLGSFSPQQKQRVEDAVTRWKRELKIQAVANVAELLEAACDRESVALASLHQGFFAVDAKLASTTRPAALAVQFLAKDNDSRFWAALERRLLNKQIPRARELLLAWSNHHLSRTLYPQNFGHRLRQLVAGIPSGVRRLKSVFPLLPTDECIRLSQFAREADHEDVRMLFNAATGEGGSGDKKCSLPAINREPPNGARNPAEATLDAVLQELDEKNLAREIGLPIDTARLSFVLDSATVESYDEFKNITAAFMVHLLRHNNSLILPVNPQAASTDAKDLLERAFSREGGVKAARQEAEDGVHSGMRRVLDVMAEQYKREAYEKRIDSVFSEALDSKDWEAKIAFTEALLKRLDPNLPLELRGMEAERCADQSDLLVRAYVDSMGSVKNVLRSL